MLIGDNRPFVNHVTDKALSRHIFKDSTKDFTEAEAELISVNTRNDEQHMHKIRNNTVFEAPSKWYLCSNGKRKQIRDANHQSQGHKELVSCIVLIIPLGGWLLSKHSTMCKLFFDPRNEISLPNNPHYHTSKVSLVSPLAINNFQSWTFSG
jgi:hypothetical protein